MNQTLRLLIQHLQICHCQRRQLILGEMGEVHELHIQLMQMLQQYQEDHCLIDTHLHIIVLLLLLLLHYAGSLAPQMVRMFLQNMNRIYFRILEMMLLVLELMQALLQ